MTRFIALCFGVDASERYRDEAKLDQVTEFPIIVV